MAGIAQNGQEHLIFIAVPQVRTKMREESKREKKHENERVREKHINIYPYVYIHALQYGANSKKSIQIIRISVIDKTVIHKFYALINPFTNLSI